MKRYLVIGLIVALALGAGLFALSGLETVEKKIALGPSPEARADRYLAAEQFLLSQNRKVTRATAIEDIADLPSQGQTLILLGNRRKISPQQSEHLLAWAEEGGHLLVVANNAWDIENKTSGDPLLDSLGIRRYNASDLDQLERESQASSTQKRSKKTVAQPDNNEAAEQPYPMLTKLYLENDSAPAYFNFSTHNHLHDEYNLAHAWANSEEATHLLQLYQGDGVITVINDPSIWSNKHIATYDHAWLLWYLTQDSEVTLLSQIDSENLAELLLRYFPEALSASLLVLILLLWQQGVRQGPLIQAVPASRRSLKEHFTASAEFLLRYSGQAFLLQRLQQEVLQRARRHHPGFERLSTVEQRRALSQLCRQSTQFVNQAMRAPGAKTMRAAQFTEQVRHLQILRNAL